MLNASLHRGLTVLLLILTMAMFPACGDAESGAGSNDAGSDAGASADTSLDGSSWKLTELGGEAPPASATVTLAFEGERAAGQSGVNRYTTGYTVAGEKLTFAPNAAGTRMAGPEDAMQFEQAYLKALAEVDGFAIDGDRLTLSLGGEPRMVFERGE